MTIDSNESSKSISSTKPTPYQENYRERIREAIDLLFEEATRDINEPWDAEQIPLILRAAADYLKIRL